LLEDKKLKEVGNGV